MKNQKTSIYSMVKYISHEILTEELLQLNTETSNRQIEKFKKNPFTLKLKFLLYKILNSIILAIQPIFLLIAFWDLNSNLNQEVHFQITIFINSANFQFFFVTQLFNFLIMGLFNLISIMSGDIYEWVKTLPLSRKELKKLVFYTIYHKLNLPIFTNILAFPIILLIATQNILVFLISLGASILNTIFSLTIMIILSEKLAKLTKKHSNKSRKPLFIQLINSFSYVLIIFGGIFIFEIFLNSIIPFILDSADLFYTPLYNITLYLIPFPFNVSYLIAVFMVMPQMPIFFWLNLSYGLVFFIISIYYLIKKSFKSLEAVVSSTLTTREENLNNIENLETFRVRSLSQFKAFIRKDFLTASKDIQTSLYFIMPIIMSFTFIFFFNFSLFAGNISLNNNLFFDNWIIITGINPIISAITVNNILNIDAYGMNMINILPINRREQARSKLFIILIIQLFALMAPTMIFLFYDRFIEIVFTYLTTLPFIIIYSLTTFILRIKLFGKKRYNYSLDEEWPEYKSSKWSLIFVINYASYITFTFLSSYIVFVFNFPLFLINELFLSVILLLALKLSFDKLFPKEKKRKGIFTVILILLNFYIFFQLLLLNMIIAFAIEIIIPVVLSIMTGTILTMKYLIVKRKRTKKKIKIRKIKKQKKKKEKGNLTFYVLIVAILFYTYTLFPVFINISLMLYILFDIYIILFGLALIPKIIKGNKEYMKQEKDSTKNFFQVDLMKALMIFLVIFDHTIPWSIKNEIGVSFWERISIPVFLVIIGFNMGLSFKRQGASSLKELYSWNYFKKKFFRYLAPFLALYIVSTIIGLFFYRFNFNAMYYGQLYPDYGTINYYLGILPFWGPGNWFIPVILGSIFILPLVYWLFIKSKIIALISCFVIEFLMQLIVFFVFGQFTSWEEAHLYDFFALNILYYLSGIGLGIWFSFGYKISEKRNLFMWILFSISLLYIIQYQFFDFRLQIDGVPFLRGDYHFLFIPYSAFLVLLAINFIPKKRKNKVAKIISTIGKSTYHILLVQILYFAVLIAIYRDHYGASILGVATDDLNVYLNFLINLSICVPIGVIWWSIENSIRSYRLYKKEENKVNLVVH